MCVYVFVCVCMHACVCVFEGGGGDACICVSEGGGCSTRSSACRTHIAWCVCPWYACTPRAGMGAARNTGVCIDCVWCTLLTCNKDSAHEGAESDLKDKPQHFLLAELAHPVFGSLLLLMHKPANGPFVLDARACEHGRFDLCVCVGVCVYVCECFGVCLLRVCACDCACVCVREWVRTCRHMWVCAGGGERERVCACVRVRVPVYARTGVLSVRHDRFVNTRTLAGTDLI